MIKMAQIEHIKKMYFLEELSIREISEITGHHRDTIAKYINLEDPEPPRYKLTKPKGRTYAQLSHDNISLLFVYGEYYHLHSWA